jgi:hypothetical protein
VVTGVTRRAGLEAAIARELVDAGAAVFITHFREYDKRQAWGVAPNEPELSSLRWVNKALESNSTSVAHQRRLICSIKRARGSGRSTFCEPHDRRIT